TAERAHQELALQILQGPAYIATRGQGAVEVAQTYARARVLCSQVPESPQLAQTLMGLTAFHLGQGEHQTAQAIGGQLLSLAHHLADPVVLLHAHGMLGILALYVGEFAPGRVHLERGITLAAQGASSPLALIFPWDIGVVCRMGMAWALQQLGYADQAYS